MTIYILKNLVEGQVSSRPSKINKSPYLADVIISGKSFMAHSPALGMSGMISPSADVYLEYCDNKKCVSQYRIRIVLVKNFLNTRKIYLGANPVLANKLVMNTFLKNTFKNNKFLKNISTNIDDWKPETKILDSRIDFLTHDGNKPVYIEVKNVPLASYSMKEIKNPEMLKFYGKKRKLFINTKNNIKFGVFPDGYSKSGSELVSERAYKHLLTLEKLSKKNRSILIFVLQRSDCKYFIPNFIRDSKYSNKLKQLVEEKKIECYVFSYKIYNKNQNFYFKFNKFIPLILDFNDNFMYTSLINKKLNVM